MAKRPRDPNQLAKSIIGIATGEIAESETPSRGRRGGLKGGKARAKTLSPQERQRIARKAAASRWAKKP